MPNAIRGRLYDYDYGPIIGRELSGCRRALVISRDDVHRPLHVAIVLPTSGEAPPGRHLSNHLEIAGTGSWASLRQMKSVEKQNLGQLRGHATPKQLDTALETIITRLSSTQTRPGTIDTEDGRKEIGKGTVWQFQFGGPDEESDESPGDCPFEIPMLVLDYNRNNQIAVAAEVEYRPNPDSPWKVPITVKADYPTREYAASALIHRIRSIDAAERATERVGAVDQDDINAVNGTLLAMLDPKQTWPVPRN